ncbi:FAD-binding protein [Actinospica sp. MGRD01-02]|uniref:FAD-binding protein n=1 Tax=Actinospica acidithermotolerans TaxID=2828514 RepID=A0A941IL80_9ACTN|nr:D-arabinono-1,4-lactone oxidase [Actinospica acidithermotolerans]MBR7829737.1 FAD-binding protein [Actinospica acidithermotolerans]
MSTSTTAPATRTWSNWAGNQQARMQRVATPSSPQEVAETVRDAAARGLTVKPVGSGHSFTPAAVTDGVQIRLVNLGRLRGADHATGLVTAEAGMPLWRLNELLAEQGLALTNMGDIQAQTVSGAIGTGTHGTGRSSASIAAQVAGLEVVLADGSIVACNALSHPDLFEAARISVGTIGVITAVTFRTEPSFLLEAREEPMRVDEVLDRFDELRTENEHFEFFWFPHTSMTTTKRNNRSAGPARPLSRRREWLEDEFLSNTVFSGICRVGRAAPRAIPAINKLSSKALSARSYVDRSDRVFTSPRTFKFLEMEYALPVEAAVPALREVKRMIDRENLRISVPVEVRCAPADDLWLSTSHGRDTAYLAFHMFQGMDQTRYFDEAEEIMLAHDGRPHWGKLHTREHDYFAAAYPRFADFLAVREKTDPDRVFANNYTRRIFGP